jgi:hypothetical protein
MNERDTVTLRITTRAYADYFHSSAQRWAALNWISVWTLALLSMASGILSLRGGMSEEAQMAAGCVMVVVGILQPLFAKISASSRSDSAEKFGDRYKRLSSLFARCSVATEESIAVLEALDDECDEPDSDYLRARKRYVASEFEEDERSAKALLIIEE